MFQYFHPLHDVKSSFKFAWNKFPFVIIKIFSDKNSRGSCLPFFPPRRGRASTDFPRSDFSAAACSLAATIGKRFVFAEGNRVYFRSFDRDSWTLLPLSLHRLDLNWTGTGNAFLSIRDRNLAFYTVLVSLLVSQNTTSLRCIVNHSGLVVRVFATRAQRRLAFWRRAFLHLRNETERREIFSSENFSTFDGMV